MPENLLEMLPRAKFQCEIDCDGHLYIDVPKFKGSIGRGFCRLLRLGENIRVKLDDIGAFVYQRCDGARTVKMIADEASRHFGNKIDPVIPRVTDFIRVLDRNGLIELIIS